MHHFKSSEHKLFVKCHEKEFSERHRKNVITPYRAKHFKRGFKRKFQNKLM